MTIDEDGDVMCDDCHTFVWFKGEEQDFSTVCPKCGNHYCLSCYDGFEEPKCPECNVEMAYPEPTEY